MRAIVDAATAASGPVRALDDYEGQRTDYKQGRAYWNEGGPVMTDVTDGVVSTDTGPVPIRILRPAPGVLPVIVFIHGGGWYLGDLETHDRCMRVLAERTGCVVVGVDYTLSPEAKFPVPVQQCVAACAYVVAHAEEWGVDGSRLSLAGDSAGAHLAMATALSLAGHGSTAPQIPLASLLLFYGLYGLTDSPARRTLGGPWDGMSRDDLIYYWDLYLASPEDARNPLVDQLSADLTSLPPTFLAVSTLDPAKDDSMALAALLERQGIPVTLTLFDGVLHGFLHYTKALDEANAAFDAAAEFYRSAVPDASPPTPPAAE
jgi:acetyl esterase